MEIILSIPIGIFVGVLASWIFWKYQFELKPDVKVSDFVAVHTDEADGHEYYRFKLVNLGHQQVTDITFNAWLCELKNVPDGEVSSGVIQLPINNSNTMTLSGINDADRPWGLTPETTFRCKPDVNLLNLLKSKPYKVLITLKASNAVSGSKVVIQKTYDRESFIHGYFSKGVDLNVHPVPNKENSYPQKA